MLKVKKIVKILVVRSLIFKLIFINEQSWNTGQRRVLQLVVHILLIYFDPLKFVISVRSGSIRLIFLSARLARLIIFYWSGPLKNLSLFCWPGPYENLPFANLALNRVDLYCHPSWLSPDQDRRIPPIVKMPCDQERLKSSRDRWSAAVSQRQ